MKILWVKSGGLVPLDHGGKIRSYYLARELAVQHDVTLFTFYPATPEDKHSELKSIFGRVISLPVPIPAQKSRHEYVAYFKNLFSGLPYSVVKYCQPQVAKELRQLMEQETFDLIVCDFLLTAAVIPWDLPGPKVVFTHNIEARIWQRHFQCARNPVWKAASYREFRTMKRMEQEYLKRADYVLTVSDVDRNFFCSFLDPLKIAVIPTGVDVNYFRSAPEAEQLNTLVFTGSMDWKANEDGMLYFVAEILPRIRRQVPDVSLFVVGRRPSARIKRLAARDSAVKITGTVADIRPYMSKASVYVVPLLVGGGTRLKIFEAMAMGKAIVSTSIGAEGLPVTPEENILIADDPVDFAHQVILLLRDPKRRCELGHAARELVERDYSWKAVGEHLNSVLIQMGRNTGQPVRRSGKI
jgi:polysaccharide biosynthesis protein PslH